MPSGINPNENEAAEKMNNTQPEVARNTDGQASETPISPSPQIYRIANSGNNNMEECGSNGGQKRGANYVRELWSEHSGMRKRMKIKQERNEQDEKAKPPKEQPKQQPKPVKQMPKPVKQMPKPVKQMPKPMKQMPKAMKSRRSSCRRPSRRRSCRRARSSRRSCRSQKRRKTYYRKRRYCCPGKRRYKASKRCCPGRYRSAKINLCNRNWARISIHPFINFLRVFRRKFCKGTSPTEIARKGKIEWKKMSCSNKKKFYEQAKRARIRGYRT